MHYEKHIMWCNRRDEKDQKVRIYGELYLPAGAEATVFTHATYPTVVMGHGFGADHRHMTPYAEALASHGCVVYNIDFAGGGPDTKSDGTMLQMSVETEALDLACALDCMRRETFCDNDELYVMGASQGGLVATLAASRNPGWVRGAILLYPAFVIADDARKSFKTPDAVPQSYESLDWTVGHRYGVDALALDPYKEMASYEGPVLIMHGRDDRIVPVSYSERAAKTFPNATLKVVDGVGHGFGAYPEVRERAAELACDFVDQTLRGTWGQSDQEA